MLHQDYDNPRVLMELPEESESLWKSEGQSKKVFAALRKGCQLKDGQSGGKTAASVELDVLNHFQ